MRVLVLDDNHTDAIIVRSLLKEQAFQIKLVSSLSEALEACSEEEFDVVLSDLNIPNCSYGESFPRIRTCFPDLALVAFSGSPPQQDIAEVDAFLPKDNLKGRTLSFVLKKAVQLRSEISELRRRVKP